MNWRRLAGRVLAIGVIGGGIVIANELFVGWHPRFGVDAYFQDVIRNANVAERFAGSQNRQIEDVTASVCDRVDPDRLNGLGISVDDRTSWSTALGGGPKPMDIWRIYEDKGAIAACQTGIRDLQIEIDRTTLACKARVRIWHAGCAI